MIKILTFVGWLFHNYKLFWYKVYKIIFKLIKTIILLINGKDIEATLKLNEWQTTRSILFFFTNILVEDKPEKDYPVKRFKIKWYLWVIHYIWAVWVLFKLSIYLSIYFLHKCLKKDLWIFLWLMLLEYWRWRLLWFKEGLLWLEIAVELFFKAYIFYITLPDRLFKYSLFFKKIIIYDKTIMPILLKTLKFRYNLWDKLLTFLGY